MSRKTKVKTTTVKLDSALCKKAETILAGRGTDLPTFLSLHLRAISRATCAVSKLTDKMPIGKYSGAIVEDVCRGDTGYMVWLLANSKVQFDPSVHLLIDSLSKVDPELPFSYE